MADKLKFELVSPERLVYSNDVDMVIVPGSQGDFGALAKHAPMIATVRPGVVEVHNGGNVSDRIFVAGGFADVTETGCTLLTEQAVPVSELQAEAVAKRLTEAEKAVKDADSDHARTNAERALLVAQAMHAAVTGGPTIGAS